MEGVRWGGDEGQLMLLLIPGFVSGMENRWDQEWRNCAQSSVTVLPGDTVGLWAEQRSLFAGLIFKEFFQSLPLSLDVQGREEWGRDGDGSHFSVSR